MLSRLGPFGAISTRILAGVIAMALLFSATRLVQAEDSISSRVQRALSGAGTPVVNFGLPPHKAAVTTSQDDPYLNTVEDLLTNKARTLRHPRFTGKVVVCFHIQPDGVVSLRDLCRKSGNPDGDKFALSVVAAVAPLPPPPSTLNAGVIWSYSFDDEQRPGAR